MRNAMFRRAPALSLADAKKNQTMMSSVAFTMAQYTVPLEQEICENTFLKFNVTIIL